MPGPRAPQSPPAGSPSPAERDALVVFADRGDSWLLRVLRPGFRHCFVVIDADAGWVIVDPLKTAIAVDFLSRDAGLDPALVYREQGHRVVRVRVRPAPSHATARVPLPLTCVNVVKRVLGIASPWVQTPFQLFCFLMRGQKAQKCP